MNDADLAAETQNRSPISLRANYHGGNATRESSERYKDQLVRPGISQGK